MTNLEKERSNQRTVAIAGGIAIIIMALAAGFSYGFVLEQIAIQGDTDATFQNLLSSEGLFIAGIAGWLVILLCDIVVAWSLYIVLQPLHKNLSLLAMLLRFAYAGILGIAILNLIIVTILINNRASFLTTDSFPVMANVFLIAFEMTWWIGLIIFGAHLLIVGYLAFQSDFIPKLVSILLWIAALAYMLIHAFYFFLPHWNAFTSVLEAVLTIPMVFGELGFGIWLLMKGGKSSDVRDKAAIK